MVINNSHYVSVTVFPDEAYPPLIIDADAMLAASIAGQLLQSVGIRTHSERVPTVKTRPARPMSLWSALVGLAALILLAAVVAATLLISVHPPVAAPATQIVSVSPQVTGQTTPLPTYPTDYPPFKQTAENAVEQTRQALILTITPFTPSHTRPPTYTLEPFIPGIYDNQAAPVSPMEYTMTNWWQDIVNGERTRVFVGAQQDKSGPTYGPAQGVVLVSVSAIDLINWDFKSYDAPANTGILQITAVNGYRLSLQDDKGTILYFDAFASICGFAVHNE
jgi:hypothetical protein